MSVPPDYQGSTGSSGRRPWVGLVAAAGLVAVAILKPWGGSDAVPSAVESSGLTSPTESAAAPATPIRAAAPAKTPAQLAAYSCHGTQVWMVFSLGRRGDQLYNVWSVTDAVAVASADPETISYTPIYSTQLLGFGYCAPDADDLRPTAADAVTIWQVDTDGRSLVAMPASSLERDLRPDFGALMKPSPPGAGGSGQPGWPAGRYLIRVGDAVLGAEVVLS